MAFTFTSVLSGMKIGKSLFDEKGAEIVGSIMKKAQAKNVKIHLPVDFRCGDKFGADAKIELADLKHGIKDGWMGLDIGPKSSAQFVPVVWKAKTIIFNGPMGVFEFPAFASGTISVLQAVAAATRMNGAFSILGGGDSVAAAKQFHIAQHVSHASTGGGASLELLEGKALPGLAALSEKSGSGKSDKHDKSDSHKQLKSNL
jgi:phosphoglycerate kinase